MEKLIPYLKTCAADFLKKAKSHGLFISFEDFYSNAMLCSWEGLIAFDQDRTLKLKNVILYRLKMSEIKTWQSYKKNGYASDCTVTNYHSACWQELDKEHIEKDNAEVMITYTWLNDSIKKYENENSKGAAVIKLMALGYSSKEAFLTINQISEYSSKERKQMERIREHFKLIYFS